MIEDVTVILVLYWVAEVVGNNVKLVVADEMFRLSFTKAMRTFKDSPKLSIREESFARSTGETGDGRCGRGSLP